MDEIIITDLSLRILDAMRARNLKEKTIKEFERYGIRRILAYCSENGWAVYSKEVVWDFVLQERIRVEEGQLPAYQWRELRRAAVFFEQMAEHGHIQENPIRSWEADHNPLFRAVAQDKHEPWAMEDLICQTRDIIMNLDISDKAKSNYIYCGLGPILDFFTSKEQAEYSEEMLTSFLENNRAKYMAGEIKRSAWQNIRKTSLWIMEYQSTGCISHRKLAKTSFVYTNPNFEGLIQEYSEFIRSAGYLKEGTCAVYVASVRGFFRRMEALGQHEYSKITLRHVTDCVSKTAKETPLGIFNTLVAMRSFAQFVLETHPELPDITPALICAPAKRRRVYEGYSDEEATKILMTINRDSKQGKRDYAMLMVAYSTGLRGCDIVNLKFSNIDWDTCEFHLVQEKTDIPLALPFDVVTGNAIADYILNARPDCDSEYVFLRMQRPYTKLKSMWTMVAGYANTALGKTGKMNGPHAFRRSMGRRLLEAGVPSSMICDVLGHASAHSLRQYTMSSLERLKQCARTMALIPVTQEELL